MLQLLFHIYREKEERPVTISPLFNNIISVRAPDRKGFQETINWLLISLQHGLRAFPPIHTYRIVCCNSKYQPFLMFPGWSFQSLLLGTIYDTSLDNYIQWVNAKQKFFCPIGVRCNLFESSSVWSYRTAKPYRKLRHL